MERAVQWIVVLTVCASLTTINVAENNERADRKLASVDTSGMNVISIDCGVDDSYTDRTTNIQYQADDTPFVQSGQIHNVASNYSFDSVNQIGKQLNTLRSFPEGKRNCYTLKPQQGKDKKYLTRAYFAYGDYDTKNQVPIFNLYLGVNNLFTIGSGDNVTPTYVIRPEVIHYATTGTIQLCLVNTDQGVPFISLLELWPLDSSIYQPQSTYLPLALMARTKVDAVENTDDLFIRYTDDIYGRSWLVTYMYNSKKTTASIDVDKLEDRYKLPTEVLSAAVFAMNLSYSLNIVISYSADYEYYVYLHFFDFEERTNNQQRIVNISVNGVEYDDAQSITLPYWKPTTRSLHIEKGTGIDNISIIATSQSDLPAMLNAYEIYYLVDQTNSATQQGDVDAIGSIKDFYRISHVDWQGDPCGPTNFTWDGLSCSVIGNNLRIISLNLSSSKLSGGIDASFSHLTNLETLDLSNNELTGEVPQFFAELPNLKILNLSRNKLMGSIPEALKAKSNSSSLQLSLDGNPGLCLINACKSNDKKSIVPLVASVATIVAILIVVVIAIAIWKLRKKGRDIPPSSEKDEQLKSRNQSFPFSEVLSITDDFKTVIGRGGFGYVYLGTMQDGIKVAVKVLSSSSMQGYKEFQSEAQLLMIVHHRNLVSLVGYCDEDHIKALIYEYLPEGNLQRQLSDKSLNVLEWSKRVQIALDTANGLDYLHNGCKPPIIHRDLKTSNILLDKSMHAKISDFGLSRAFANDFETHVSTHPAGTPGYLDPEFHSCGNLNKKSDVYAFGIVLLELITGQPPITGTTNNPIHILQWVNLKLATGDIQAIVDPRLQGNYNTASAWKFLEIALSCLPQTAIQRPDITHIVSDLKDLSLEISLERTVSDSRKFSNYFDMGPLQVELDVHPNTR